MMKIFTRIKDWQHFRSQNQGKKIGLVPTMGALHKGHLELVRQSLAQTDLTVCSIFVNPTQFDRPDDLKKYPRTPEKDIALLEAAGCHAVWLPTVEEMYLQQPVVTFGFGPLEQVMEGANRPGHFNGVGLVVSKLFNIIEPQVAFFGQKDFQQLAIIKQMTQDLSFPIEIVGVPIVREESGLALSSRNALLSEVGKKQATGIFKVLTQAVSRIRQQDAVKKVLTQSTEELKAQGFEPEYLILSDAITLAPVNTPANGQPLVLCVVAWLEGVRLIDNVSFEY